MVSESQIQEDLTRAMKAREMERVYVLRGLVAAIKNAKVEKQTKSLPESDVAALVRKEISKRNEAADFARQAGRSEMVDQNEREKAFLEAYLPQQMSSEALEAAIRQIAGELGSNQIGPIMAKLRDSYSGQYDGKLASELIRKLG